MKEEAKEKIRQFLQKKNAGTITPAEQATLEEYLVTGEFLDLLHAKARRTLREVMDEGIFFAAEDGS